MESDESTTNGSKTVFHKVALPDYNSKFILGVHRRKVFFNYKKRLRLQSPRKKVSYGYCCYLLFVGSSCHFMLAGFEYFASFQILKGELFIRLIDLMQAVVHFFLHLNPTLLEMVI
ncbi:hypothetical protein CXB51_008566 [Gossypium anomalum]|uniref:Uncharacterized protein n=1 Tax=Gossypium anomalum TaxID=47600 RepID=A0A8J5ZSS0_9ROSI|nr:hypothetical protein CXB51_008566 [Gossypium anomalum]